MALSDGQLSFNGYILGDDVATFMDEVTGWDDLPPVASGNSGRSLYYGSWPGAKIAGERVVTWSGKFNPRPAAAWSDSLRALRAAFTVSDVESELTINLHGEELSAFAAVTARALPGNRRYGAAHLGDLAIQFTCSDPRRYAGFFVETMVPFPTEASGGLEYPLIYPLGYGLGGASSGAAVANSGDAMLPAVYTIHGQCVTPKLVVNGWFAEFDMTLASGDTLEIDTAAETVTLNGTADRLYTRTIYSSPLRRLELAPGDNTVSVSAESNSAGAYATVYARAGAFI